MSNCSFSSPRSFWKITLILQLFIFPFSFQAHSQNFKQNFNNVVGRSNFIFLGTVTHMDSSNIAVKLLKKRKAIVKVDEVIDATEPLSNMKGKEITVVFAPGTSPPKSNKKVFYTFIWYYGNTLGVKEVKNDLGQNFHPQLASQIQQSRLKIADDSLSAELRRAKIVVLATVKSLSEYVRVKGFEQSEHNPRFRTAVLNIKAVLKGNPMKDTLVVYYSSSYDVMWIDSPKLSEGQTGIFLLPYSQVPRFFKINGYTVLDARDVQRSDQLEKIKRLLLALSINKVAYEKTSPIHQ